MYNCVLKYVQLCTKIVATLTNNMMIISCIVQHMALDEKHY